VSNIQALNPKKTVYVEIITIVVYACALIFIMYYHEPWFDEAQAWLIARDATIWKLVSSITHYEGHPPIWFLILMPLAKNGVPFELGLKAVNFTFATLAMGIFIFKAPFPRLVRCTIPFTYFFFYQYGVISRPYSLMMLGFVLSAWFYKDRNEKPCRYVAALSIICGASAFGIVLAAGICLVWLWEIFDQSVTLEKLKSFIRSKKFSALIILFIYNILLVICICPFTDTLGIHVKYVNSYIIRLLYMFVMAPADAICSDTFRYGLINISLNVDCICSIILGCLINITLYIVTKIYKKKALWIVPYFVFAVFSATVYFYSHHIGIVTMFYIFLFWCCLSERPEELEIPYSIIKLFYAVSYKIFFRYCSYILIFTILGTSIYWSISASKNDIFLNYGTGRDLSSFISNNGLDRLKIMVAWLKTVDPDTGETYVDYNYLQGIPSLAYFNKNIYYNFNNGINNECYLTHKIDNDGSSMKKFRSQGYPDVLLGYVDLKFIFASEINIEDYLLVKVSYGNMIWKDKLYENAKCVYLRKDLLKSYPYMSRAEMPIIVN
jgi:hypothetical protein